MLNQLHILEVLPFPVIANTSLHFPAKSWSVASPQRIDLKRATALHRHKSQREKKHIHTDTIVVWLTSTTSTRNLDDCCIEKRQKNADQYGHIKLYAKSQWATNCWHICNMNWSIPVFGWNNFEGSARVLEISDQMTANSLKYSREKSSFENRRSDFTFARDYLYQDGYKHIETPINWSYQRWRLHLLDLLANQMNLLNIYNRAINNDSERHHSKYSE